MPPKRVNNPVVSGDSGSPGAVSGPPQKRVNDGIPRNLPWSEDRNAKVYEFIAELEEYENFRVLFGKQDATEVRLSLSLSGGIY